MRRLYLQFYVTILAILFVAMLTVGALWRFGFDESRFHDAIGVAGELVSAALPPAGAPTAELEAALQHLHLRMRADLALYGADGGLIAAAGRRLPPPRPDRAGGWMRGPRSGPAVLLRLTDGRSLQLALPRGPWRPGTWLLAGLGGIALAVGLGAYPVARRLTRRLERLKASVERLGEGDLAARAQVEGRDEVAALAASFNRSATRIEHLVNSHQMLLANCSHELRTPLTRIGVALTLLGEAADPRLRQTVRADIAELDQLIEEILLASRLQAVPVPERAEDVDLLALAAEEAAREGISAEGDAAGVPPVRGDATLLRRMIRNLIDNARRHGGDQHPEVRVTADGRSHVAIAVRDHGPGVAEAERERIFEPFYRPAGFAESGRGSGLGLALVRQIARHHGGDVSCSMAAGGGSLFTVTLPLTTEA